MPRSTAPPRPAAPTLPPVVSAADWQAARAALLVKEKAATRTLDALAAERRRLPHVAFGDDYAFDGPDGEARLLDLFEGRRQLIVYHFMFGPEAAAGCTGCTMFGDQVSHLAHLHACDVSIAFVSPAPLERLLAYRERMGWSMPWYSLAAGSRFNADCGVSGGFGLSVFIRDGDAVRRSYFTSGRGVEMLGSVWTFLDLTPLGRQEEWEDSPQGYPQTAPYEWWQRHDEY
jgi:predicted dithiol-disulfide oxidoreductase (DUF899 family)